MQRELFLVGESKGVVVATLLGGYDGFRCWVYHVAVDAAHRRKGYGRAMMREAERLLTRTGCPKLNIQVRAHNHGVVEFYERLGYAVDDHISMGKLLTEEMELVFVYNAKSGKISALLDLGHKIVNPESYKCNLCNLTHGNFTERKEWKRFKESTELGLVFLHKDEFEREYGKRFSYPIVLKRDKEFEVFISTEELNEITSPTQLIELLQKRATGEAGHDVI